MVRGGGGGEGDGTRTVAGGGEVLYTDCAACLEACKYCTFKEGYR